jgi:hypothetical protein
VMSWCSSANARATKGSNTLRRRSLLAVPDRRQCWPSFRSGNTPRSDLAAAAGPRLGSAKEPAPTPARRRLVRCQRHVPVLPVRPLTRAHARAYYDVTRHVAASRYLAIRSGFVVTSDHPNPLSIGVPAQTLGLGVTRTTSLRLRTCRFTAMEAATRLACTGHAECRSIFLL